MLDWILSLFWKNKKEKCLTCDLVKCYWEYKNDIPYCPCCGANPTIKNYYKSEVFGGCTINDEWEISPQFMERFRKN